MRSSPSSRINPTDHLICAGPGLQQPPTSSRRRRHDDDSITELRRLKICKIIRVLRVRYKKQCKQRDDSLVKIARLLERQLWERALDDYANDGELTTRLRDILSDKKKKKKSQKKEEKEEELEEEEQERKEKTEQEDPLPRQQDLIQSPTHQKVPYMKAKGEPIGMAGTAEKDVDSSESFWNRTSDWMSMNYPTRTMSSHEDPFVYETPFIVTEFGLEPKPN